MAQKGGKDRDMTCTHQLDPSSIRYARGTGVDGAFIVDVLCLLCGKAGSARLLTAEIMFDDDEKGGKE
jgi:hypothetical protein